MRFKIDENLPSDLSALLIDAGFDSTTVPDQRLTGAHDSVVFQVCQSEGRTLITLDVGFGDIREYPPEGARCGSGAQARAEPEILESRLLTRLAFCQVGEVESHIGRARSPLRRGVR